MQPITCHRPHKVANNRIRFVSGSVSTSAGERERCRAMTPPSLPQVERPPPLAPANQLEVRPAAPRHRRLAVGVAVVLHDHQALRTGPARAAERGHGRPCRYRVRPLTQARPRRPRGGARAGAAFGHHQTRLGSGQADQAAGLEGWRGLRGRAGAVADHRRPSGAQHARRWPSHARRPRRAQQHPSAAPHPEDLSCLPDSVTAGRAAPRQAIR